MDDAGGLVDVHALGHHDARIGAGADLVALGLFIVGQGDPVDILAGRHGDPDGPVAQAHDFADDLLFLGLDQAGIGALGQDGLDLFLGDDLAPFILDPDEPEQAGGRQGQEADEGMHGGRHERQGPSHHGGDGFRIDHGEPLGRQLPEDQGQIGQDHDHQAGGQDVGIGFQQGNGVEGLVELAGDGGLAIGAGQDADQGDADLDGGQEAGGIFGQFQGGGRPLVTLFGPGLKLGAAGGHHRQFRHGEDTVQHHKQQHDSAGDK